MSEMKLDHCCKSSGSPMSWPCFVAGLTSPGGAVGRRGAWTVLSTRRLWSAPPVSAISMEIEAWTSGGQAVRNIGIGEASDEAVGEGFAAVSASKPEWAGYWL